MGSVSDVSVLCVVAASFVRDVSTLEGSKGDVSTFFLAAVLHGSGTKPAGVRAFRMR